MKCENCGNDHDGDYGSGRFCSSKCARGFATKAKRLEINEKVSLNMKGMKSTGKPFKKGYDERRIPLTKEVREKGLKSNRLRLLEINEGRNVFYINKEYDKLLAKSGLIGNWYKEKIKIEQNNKCICCGNYEWMGEKLVIEIHHKDGNKYNNDRDNLEAICPNCHSITPNWKTRGGKNKYKLR